MTPWGRFFLPGPTEVRPEVLAAMNQPVIGHRGPEMTALLRQADPGLRALFRTTRPVYVSTSAATGLMEAGVRCGVRKRALALVNGAFAERFRDLVGDCGRDCESYTVPWGEAHDPSEVERRLRAGKFDAVTVTHSETSTGVLNPLPEIAEAVRAVSDDILLLVDGVTSVGGTRVETDAWVLDCTLTGSQKAMALPPGLAFGTASARMLERAGTMSGRGQYFDLLDFDAQWKRFQTPQTPAVNLIYALVEQLARMEREGWEARLARHQQMAERCWQWAEDQGLQLLAPAGYRSPTVTTISLPPEHPGSRVAARLVERDYTIGAGYGKLKDATLRIGHMGDHTVEELDALLAELGEVLT
ncbi:alanine--glyoxylate aminotransferase family protein [soil metagenome]